MNTNLQKTNTTTTTNMDSDIHKCDNATSVSRNWNALVNASNSLLAKSQQCTANLAKKLNDDKILMTTTLSDEHTTTNNASSTSSSKKKITKRFKKNCRKANNICSTFGVIPVEKLTKNQLKCLTWARNFVKKYNLSDNSQSNSHSVNTLVNRPNILAAVRQQEPIDKLINNKVSMTTISSVEHVSNNCSSATSTKRIIRVPSKPLHHKINRIFSIYSAIPVEDLTEKQLKCLKWAKTKIENRDTHASDNNACNTPLVAAGQQGPIADSSLIQAIEHTSNNKNSSSSTKNRVGPPPELNKELKKAKRLFSIYSIRPVETLTEQQQKSLAKSTETIAKLEKQLNTINFEEIDIQTSNNAPAKHTCDDNCSGMAPSFCKRYGKAKRLNSLYSVRPIESLNEWQLKTFTWAKNTLAKMNKESNIKRKKLNKKIRNLTSAHHQYSTPFARKRRSACKFISMYSGLPAEILTVDESKGLSWALNFNANMLQSGKTPMKVSPTLVAYRQRQAALKFVNKYGSVCAKDLTKRQSIALSWALKFNADWEKRKTKTNTNEDSNTTNSLQATLDEASTSAVAFQRDEIASTSLKSTANMLPSMSTINSAAYAASVNASTPTDTCAYSTMHTANRNFNLDPYTTPRNVSMSPIDSNPYCAPYNPSINRSMSTINNADRNPFVTPLNVSMHTANTNAYSASCATLRNVAVPTSNSNAYRDLSTTAVKVNPSIIAENLTEQQSNSLLWSEKYSACQNESEGNCLKRHYAQEEQPIVHKKFKADQDESERNFLKRHCSQDDQPTVYKKLKTLPSSHYKDSNNSFIRAVVDRSNINGHISPANWTLVQDALNKVYFGVCYDNPGPAPTCSDFGWHLGRIKLMAFPDQRSIDLYSIAISRVGEVWPRADLWLCRKEEIPFKPCIRAFIPVQPSNPYEILNIIQKSNPDLPTQDWKVAKVESAKGFSRMAVIIVNAQSLPLLEKRQGQISYGFGSISFENFINDNTSF